MTGTAFVTERDLARTYDGGAYENTWEAVEQYRAATRYANTNDVGSGATASALDLPRSRIRTWVDQGGEPDAVRAIDTARGYGWLECTPDDDIFAGLNALVANVFSGGSIADSHYRPSFALNHRGEDSHVIDALELVGVDYQIVDDRDGRADEARPTEDGTVLGRVLAVLGAPVGPKADQLLSLPDYLVVGSVDVRETFVYAYLENRAVHHEGKDTMTITEERNDSYLSSLAVLINDIAGGGVTRNSESITISADAARSLGTVR
ncbi:uncharacterized protein Nmag_0293 [Natrialba magadii ATCC 43099]|uniref:Uncharacterized protein n=1 Tax=Natrialba magadii (strain ATCC 43099 / DSM 3394 / CCM 3739 / CIP 104546 / IAM 13178 / JCM 8861 / NBRC 102185 / NCIMB 2190 / MS3) TaxID=547559 RepID=D3SX65_NATMM|nr:hypothetical protein [Natrialba magadii]ADD03885.1 uncharacterized protein Nmag_0293 [Natrialba magadii ATCC 43099]ELY33544.1 hypothetical protein C500_01890 [Natrialba magadii ATCC 43099]